MSSTQIGYALACVLVPIAWGLVIVWISNRIDRRVVGGHSGATRRPHHIEYHI